MLHPQYCISQEKKKANYKWMTKKKRLHIYINHTILQFNFPGCQPETFEFPGFVGSDA